MPAFLQQTCQKRFSAILAVSDDSIERELAESAKPVAKFANSEAAGTATGAGASLAAGSTKGFTMIGKIAGALLGNRLAGRSGGLKGALLGAAGARIAGRGLGPLGTALAVGSGAKKLYNWNRTRKTSPSYPSSATPSHRDVRTHGV
jgi:hypothetical protein